MKYSSGIKKLASAIRVIFRERPIVKYALELWYYCKKIFKYTGIGLWGWLNKQQKLWQENQSTPISKCNANGYSNRQHPVRISLSRMVLLSWFDPTKVLPPLSKSKFENRLSRKCRDFWLLSCLTSQTRTPETPFSTITSSMHFDVIWGTRCLPLIATRACLLSIIVVESLVTRLSRRHQSESSGGPDGPELFTDMNISEEIRVLRSRSRSHAKKNMGKLSVRQSPDGSEKPRLSSGAFFLIL